MTMYGEYAMNFYNGVDGTEIAQSFLEYIKKNHSDLCDNLEELEGIKYFEELLPYLNAKLPDEVISEMTAEFNVSVITIFGVEDFSHTPSFQAFLKSGAIISGELDRVCISYGSGGIEVDTKLIKGLENENFDVVGYGE